MMGDSWSVVKNLGLNIDSMEAVKGKILVYGSSDPCPNPGELLLTEIVSLNLGVEWNFFVYKHGKNLYNHTLCREEKSNFTFTFESIIDYDLSLRKLAEDIFRLREEPVIIAHTGNGKTIRATTNIKEVPDINIFQLHSTGGWLGGAGIHYFLRLYAEKRDCVVYLCPFQQKGRVYEIYKGVRRKLFILTPFVRLSPPSAMAPNGWEPLTWDLWRALPARARRLARNEIQRGIKEFFLRGEPRRIELPWRWWER